MNSFILHFKYWDGYSRDYGMQFEDGIPDDAAFNFIEEFLSANGFVKMTNGRWADKNLTVVTITIKKKLV